MTPDQIWHLLNAPEYREDAMDSRTESHRQLADRSRVREIARRCWGECNCDPIAALKMAESEIRDQLATTMVFASFQAAPGWAKEFFDHWVANQATIVTTNYQRDEPGFVAAWEDDEP